MFFSENWKLPIQSVTAITDTLLEAQCKAGLRLFRFGA